MRKLTKYEEKTLYDYCNSFFAQGLGFHVIDAACGYKSGTTKKLYYYVCEKNRWKNKYPMHNKN